MGKYKYILFFDQIGIDAISKVGGKNASLDEMYNQLNPIGISIPNGFAVTAESYRLFRKTNNLEQPLQDLLFSLDTKEYSNLSAIGEKARNLILSATIPDEIRDEINTAYKSLSEQCNLNTLDIVVRSSVKSEDLPTASFADQMQSFLNINGATQLLDAVHRCFVSLFTDRAIKYRHDIGFTISNTIKIHPLALCEHEKIIDEKIIAEIATLTKGYENPKNYFIDKLAEAEAIVAATFYPKEVIVRMSDFKSNEYANLIGGKCAY